MALGALAVSALGTGLGTLAGDALVGDRQLGFLDTAKTSSVTQLNPAQLQQILNDLTAAEGTARGDIGAGVSEALGFLTGDTGVVARQNAISREARKLRIDRGADVVKNRIVRGIQAATPFLGSAASSAISERIGDNLREILDFSGEAPSLAASSSVIRDIVKDIAPNISTGIITNAISEVLANPRIEEEFREVSAEASAEAEQLVRAQQPELFATEGGVDRTDPFLRSQQEINLAALAQNQQTLDRIAALSGLSGSQGQPVLSPAEIQAQLEQTPGFQFRMQQGRQAVERSGAARGLLESGAILKGLTEFGQGLASQEFGAEHSRLATLAGLQGTRAGLTSNAALVGSTQPFQRDLAAADLLATQGQNLGQIALASAQQRSSALQQGGTRTTDVTQSQLFDLNRLQRI